MKTKNVLFLLISILFLSCIGQTKKTENLSNEAIFQSIDAKTFSDKLLSTKDAQIIDVRTPNEFAGQHLDNALNISTQDSKFEEKIKNLDKSKPTFVYCLSGGRSRMAASKMQDLGFSEVYEMQGGMMRYNALGLGKKTSEAVGMTMEEYQKLVNSDKKVLIDFYAEWCGPCKKMAPYLDKMTKELKDNVTIIRIDADKNKTIAEELKVEGLPTLLLYKKNKITWQNLGYITEEDLRKQL